MTLGHAQFEDDCRGLVHDFVCDLGDEDEAPTILVREELGLMSEDRLFEPEPGFEEWAATRPDIIPRAIALEVVVGIPFRSLCGLVKAPCRRAVARTRCADTARAPVRPLGCLARMALALGRWIDRTLLGTRIPRVSTEG